MQYAIETITPQRAAEYLAKADNVRGLRAADVRKLARAMQENAWHVNGETVKFAPGDVLIDGQHRMSACVAAGVPFTTLVVRGVTNASEIDTGLGRAADQLLAHRGEKHADQLAATARLMWLHTTLGSALADAKRVRPSVAELLQVVAQHPGMRESVARTQAAKVVHKGLLAFIHYMAQEHFSEHAELFVDELIRGTGLNEGNPVYALRERLHAVAMTAQGVKIDRHILQLLLVKAWNAYALDQKIYHLKAPLDSEVIEIVADPKSPYAIELLRNMRNSERLRERRWNGSARARR